VGRSSVSRILRLVRRFDQRRPLGGAPGKLLDVKGRIRAVAIGDARALAARVLAASSAAEVAAMLAERSARFTHLPRLPAVAVNDPRERGPAT
jgi:hypothetical protein